MYVVRGVKTAQASIANTVAPSESVHAGVGTDHLPASSTALALPGRPAQPPRRAGVKRDATGHRVTNNAGLDICPWYSSGTCDPQTSSGRCPWDNALVHQCYVCLRNTHGGDYRDAAMREAAGGKAKGKRGKAR